MGFMEELKIARMQGFTKNMKDGWEARINTAYQDMLNYMLHQAADIVLMSAYERNEYPISTQTLNIPGSVKTLSDKELVLLAQKLANEGLDVRTRRVGDRLIIDAKLPPLPNFFGDELATRA